MSSSETVLNKSSKKESEGDAPVSQYGIEDQGPSGGLKAEVSIKIMLKPDENRTQHSSLQSLDELSELLRQNQRIDIDDNESFITIESNNRDMTTTTDPEIGFSRDPRTQNAIVARNAFSSNNPPPPYYVANTPVYTDAYNPVDATRVPSYRVPSYSSRDHFSSLAFQERWIRHQFIQKVYAILTIQLLITFGFVALAVFFEPLKIFLINTTALMWVSIIIFWPIYITLICFTRVRRIYPLNLILLMVLTCCMAYLSAYLSCWAKTSSVLYAVGITALICFVISVIACQSWCDITSCGMFLFVATLVVFIFGLITMIISIFTYSNIMYLIYAGLACLLFSLYLLYDTQQILGGKRVELSPEEYILGALTLYVDIIMIFIDVLSFFR